MNAQIRSFFHEPTFTVSYLVSDPETGAAAVIDPVLDFDQKSGRTRTKFADEVLAAAEAEGLRIDWVMETHAHADHLSAAQHIKARTGAKVVIGAEIGRVQKVFKDVFNATEMPVDGRQFDRLVGDGERIALGALAFEVMHTPGHTPACVTYRIGNAAFIGDTLFMPDYGTARADFPGGDARTLYRSIRHILSLPPETRLFLCHDYKAPGRDVFVWETTVAEQRAHNRQAHDGISEDEFVTLRTKRDRELEMPVLLLPSIQVNMRAGHMPPAEPNGTVYLKLPVNRL